MKKKMIAEFIGTMVLTLFGCGSAVLANSLMGGNGASVPLGYTTLVISFAFGLSVVAMAYAIGGISGCHINPAVSFGMLVAGRMKLNEFFCYIAAQFAGGIVGSVIMVCIFGGNSSLGTNGYGAASAIGLNMWGALLAEIILTFVFVITILGVTENNDAKGVSGLVIGLTLVLVHIFGIPLTGTSVNPARSFGPALLSWSQNNWQALAQVWVFIVAPLLGAALAASVYTLLTAKEEEKTVEGEKPAEEVAEEAKAIETEAIAEETTEEAPVAEVAPVQEVAEKAKPAAKKATSAKSATKKATSAKPAAEKAAPARKPRKKATEE